MTVKKTDRVTAKFGGRELEFCIPREKLPAFEACMRQPAQRVLAEIIGGHANITLIQRVIEYAAPSGIGRTLPGAGDLSFHPMRMEIEAMSGRTKSNFVTEVFKTNPPMKYAVLAQGILAAALHGIPEDAARFDEDEEDVADV